MTRKDRRILGGDSWGTVHHGTFFQNGVDNHEWDMEPPPKSLGSYPRHTNKKSRSPAKPKKVWKKRTFSLPRDTSSWQSNDYVKSIGYTTYQPCRHQPSFPQLSKEMSAGGEHEIWTRFTYGILWTIRTDKTRWRPSVKKTTGWFGKRRMTNGHRSWNGRASTRYYIWTKTPERTAGAIKSRDGGGEETSKTQNSKERGNAGWNAQVTCQMSQPRTLPTISFQVAIKHTTHKDTGTELWKR